MAITLADAQKLSTSKLAHIVIDEFRNDPLFDMMLFDNSAKLQGGSSLSYVYNRVTTQPTAAFRKIGEDYNAQEALTTQYTVTLKPFGGSFNVDRVLQANEKEFIDLVRFEIAQKVKATRALFTDTFINGDTSVDESAFDGINSAVSGSTTEISPESAIDLSASDKITENAVLFMDLLDSMLAELDGTPSAILVNKKLASVINGIARRSGFFSSDDADAFGHPITKYAGIPIIALGDKPGNLSPIIDISSDNGTTSLYAARIGLDGVHAVSPEGNGVINTYLPDITTPGAVKCGEVEMVSAMALKSTRAIGALRNIKIA